MDTLLSKIASPDDLKGLSQKKLQQLAREMREALCRLVATRSAHFASNLGVIELTLALHTAFDFRRDRLIWDTGHQIYPHKMLTGRYGRFATMRTKGGLMGYPNPAESDYDLFLTGHAGCSVGTALGMKCGDELVRPDETRHVVAVIGDGAFSSGIVVEAMNNAGGLKKNFTVILNDNKMAICRPVGGMADSLGRIRMNSFYTGLKGEVQKLLGRFPTIGDPVEHFIYQIKDAVKAGLLGGMLFEELGFRYIGPVDGHNIALLQKYMQMVQNYDDPVLLHVVTEKGHGFKPAAEDPTSFHAPAPFARENGSIVSFKVSDKPSYTEVVRGAILRQMTDDPRVTAITAAMCQGLMFEPIRDEFPERFFDVGICESHAVAFAAGLAKAGLRPIVDIYSTFMQRSYDQIFQEVALQELPVTLLLDRSGLVGADGPTHHGVFDLTYLRPLPNMVVMAPGDALDVAPMIDFALKHDGPTAIRYPRAPAETIRRTPAPIQLGVAETIRRGGNGMIVACGSLLCECLEAAGQLAREGVAVGVINARFIKPLDTKTILAAVRNCPFVLTVEEGQLMGGFGSAVLEAANNAGLETSHIRRLGIGDFYVEHGARSELLADLGLDAAGVAKTCRAMIGTKPPAPVATTTLHTQPHPAKFY